MNYEDYTNKVPVDYQKYNDGFYDGEIFETVKGNSVCGQYIDVIENIGKYHTNMFIILKSDGTYCKIFGCTSLDRQMKKVNINDSIEIEYFGLKNNGITQYHEYKVSKLYYD